MTALQTDREAMTVAAGTLDHCPFQKPSIANYDNRVSVDVIGDF